MMIISLSCTVCDKHICDIMVKHDYDLLKILGSLCEDCKNKGKTMPIVFDDLT